MPHQGPLWTCALQASRRGERRPDTDLDSGASNDWQDYVAFPRQYGHRFRSTTRDSEVPLAQAADRRIAIPVGWSGETFCLRKRFSCALSRASRAPSVVELKKCTIQTRRLSKVSKKRARLADERCFGFVVGLLDACKHTSEGARPSTSVSPATFWVMADVLCQASLRPVGETP
jgi:hypothetical protein